MIISFAQREHFRAIRTTRWCQGGMLHRNSKDGRYNQIFGNTSWECISNESKDKILVDQDRGVEEMEKYRK